jgi:hypothetical protein
MNSPLLYNVCFQLKQMARVLLLDELDGYEYPSHKDLAVRTPLAPDHLIPCIGPRSIGPMSPNGYCVSLRAELAVILPL